MVCKRISQIKRENGRNSSSRESLVDFGVSMTGGSWFSLLVMNSSLEYFSSVGWTTADFLLAFACLFRDANWNPSAKWLSVTSFSDEQALRFSYPFVAVFPWNIECKASIADIKSVVATLEPEVTEIKNVVSKASQDIYNAKMSLLEDKMVQLDNSYKMEIKTLFSRVMDLETINECLEADNTKLKTKTSRSNLKGSIKE